MLSAFKLRPGTPGIAGIDAYIREAMDLVKDVDAVLTNIKDNVRATQARDEGTVAVELHDRRAHVLWAQHHAHEQSTPLCLFAL